MTSLDLVKPWRLIISMPMLLYAVLLLELPQSSIWLLLSLGVVVLAVAVAARLEYPLLVLWPAFVGLFVVSACVCALTLDVVDYAIVPLSDSHAEIMVVGLIGVGFVGWGIRALRRAMTF